MGHRLFMEDDRLDGCWCLWLLIETVYSHVKRRGREMLTLSCGRILRRMEVGAEVQMVLGTAVAPITSSSMPPQLLHVLVCSPVLFLSPTPNKPIGFPSSQLAFPIHKPTPEEAVCTPHPSAAQGFWAEPRQAFQSRLFLCIVEQRVPSHAFSRWWVSGALPVLGHSE